MLNEEDITSPQWLEDLKLEKRKEAKLTNRKYTNRQLKEMLEEKGLTIVIDDKGVVEVENDPNESWEDYRTWSQGRVLSVKAQVLRNAFAVEFLKDFNGKEAAKRIGSNDPYRLWSKLRDCPYTQRIISKKLSEWEASAVVTRDKICAALWKEGNDHEDGTPTSRVAALSKLAKIMGYEVDTININANVSAELLQKPLSKQEFLDMKETFNEEF